MPDKRDREELAGMSAVVVLACGVLGALIIFGLYLWSSP